MAVAYAIAKRSTCSRRNNGAVVATYEGVVLSTGYNGSLSGMPHCDHECNCPKSIDGWEDVPHSKLCHSSETSCPVSVHAEANAIYFAARHGVAVANSLIYCTTEPCIKCAEAIVQSGISECWYYQEYRTHDGIDLLHRAGVSIHHYYSKAPVGV